MCAAEDLGKYFRIPPDPRDMNYEIFVEEGEPNISNSVEYTSHNTEILTVKQMKSLLRIIKLDNVSFEANTISEDLEIGIG